MTERCEEACRIYAAGGNCCQSVTTAFSRETGLDAATSMRLGASFGGGMRNGEVCGAVTGGLMVLGLRHGAEGPEDQKQKALADGMTIDFMNAFKEECGSFLCRELLEEGGKKNCPRYIGVAVGLVEKIL